MADISKITIPNGSSTSTYNLKDASAITNITRSGTTFTATKRDGTTFTFTQQDNNTDTLVSQTNSTANCDLRVLLSLSANDTTETKGSYKSTNFKANPSTGKFRATSFNVADHVTQQYNSTTQALDFIFN